MTKNDQELDDGTFNQLYTIESPDASKAHKNRGWTARHTFALMNLIGQAIALMNRGCISIAIVAMVSSSSNATDNIDYGNVCPVPANNTRVSDKEGEFDWDEQLQGMIMGSFFYGYVPSCFLGGLAAEYFGNHLTFGISIFGLSVLSLVSPISARTSVGLFIAVRVVSGIVQSTMYPSLHALMVDWVPPKLRTKYNAVCLTGFNVGTVLTMALGGIMCNSSFLGGWPSVFYVFGSAGIIWSILWFLLVKAKPRAKPSDCAEKNLLTMGNKLRNVDWRAIFLSVPFWGLVIFHFGDSFGFYTLSSEIPTYLSNIQYFDLDKNGLLSSLPYMLQVILSIVWGFVANYFITSKRISTLASRRVSTAVGMYCAGLALVIMCFVNCNSTLAVVVLCVAVAMTGASNSGGYLGEQDMCPSSLVAVVKGISNTIAAVPGFLAPLVAGTIISGNETLSAWRTVFLISAALYFVPGTIYLIFATDKQQPWIKTEKRKVVDKY